MGIFSSIMIAALAAFLMWMLFRTIKHNPEQFSSKYINKSLFTLGILAIILIVVIGFVVMLLRV